MRILSLSGLLLAFDGLPRATSKGARGLISHIFGLSVWVAGRRLSFPSFGGWPCTRGWRRASFQTGRSGLRVTGHPRRRTKEGLFDAISFHGFSASRGRSVCINRKRPGADRRIRCYRSRFGGSCRLRAPGLVASPAKRKVRAAASDRGGAGPGDHRASATRAPSRQAQNDGEKSHDRQSGPAKATAMIRRRLSGGARNAGAQRASF
jgi:hypothetical protein